MKIHDRGKVVEEAKVASKAAKTKESKEEKEKVMAEEKVENGSPHSKKNCWA